MFREHFTKTFRIVFALVVLMAVPCRFSLADDSDGRFLLSTGFSGTNNDPGWLFKLDAAAGYRFNSHFEIAAGLPVYFVQVPGDDTLEDNLSSKTGIGNFYVDVRLMTGSNGIYFSTSLRGTAPTGDEEEGFSSGRGTFDWNNYFEYNTGNWTPFGIAGIANSISDTHFFTRPFTSLGLVGQLEGGLLYDPAWWIGFGGSGYGVIPSGDQKIYSRLVSSTQSENNSPAPGNPETDGRRKRVFEDTRYVVVEADLARDYGFSGWLDIYSIPNVVLEVGYNRSVSYEYNTVFFSVRFDLAGMIRKDDSF